jgi:GT2 family glycosyltransferase
MADPPEVTVLVPTFRRPDGLARTLRSLAAQQGAPAYRIVVIDNDNDPHPPLSVPPTVQLLREARPGAAAARNSGLAEADTPLVAMLDDDVVADPGWLRALAAPALEGRADVTGGAVLLDPAVPRPRWLSPGLEGYLSALDLGPLEQELRPDQILLTASLLTRTELLRDVGGFDTALGHRGTTRHFGEDVQAVRGLRQRGARVLWVPSAVVIHDVPAERLRPRWLLRRAYQQGRSDWQVERDAMSARAARGGRVAVSWWAAQSRQRISERPMSRAVALHAACDAARTAGAFAEAASWR